MPYPWRYNLDRLPRRVRNQRFRESMAAVRAIIKPMPKETITDKMACVRMYHLLMQAVKEGAIIRHPEETNA